MNLKIKVWLIYLTIVTALAVATILHYTPKVESLEVHHVVKVPALLQKIGFCESGNHQFNPDGTVKRGKVNPQDIGKYQINLKYQGARAKAMGYDLFTESGNEGYAIWLFKADGSFPWNWSKPCWTK